MSDAAAPRAASFDSLRGLAALLVGIQLCAEILVFHLADDSVASWPRVLVYDFSLTNAGIPVFFLISGYFVAASFRGPRPIRDFVARRVMRLYPVFLLAALVAAALLPFENGMAIGARDIARSLVLMDPIAPATPFAHIHWMLMVLLGFYAMCVAAALLGGVHTLFYPTTMIVVLLAAVGGMLVAGHLYHRHFPIAVMLALVLAHLGALTARLQAKPGDRARAWWLLPAVAAAILLASRFGWSTAWGSGELWIGKALGYALAMALFAACAFGHLGVPRLLAGLGALSYPLFFFLPAALAFAASRVMNLPFQERLLPLLLAVAAAVILALLTHRLVELPIARRRHRVLAAP